MIFRLIPLQNVKTAFTKKFQWEAENNDPQFLIDNWESLRGRIAQFACRINTRNQRGSSCKLYVDYGKGYSENGAIHLEINQDGIVDQQIEFPTSLVGLRFDPISQAGSFSILDLAIDLVEHSKVRSERIIAACYDTHGFQNWSGDCYDLSYRKWIELNEPSPSDYDDYRKQVEDWPMRPLISIALPTFNTPPQWLRKAIDSIIGQVYEQWELCIADDCSTNQETRSILSDYADSDNRIKIVYRDKNGHISAASNTAIDMATGDYIGFLDHDDELHPLALLHMAAAIQAIPNAILFFSDEDKISVDGVRSEPYFKPSFNYDLFLSQNMICHFSVLKAEALKQLKGFRMGFEGAQDYDLALRTIDTFGQCLIYHVPHVLYHWRMIPESTASGHKAKPYAASAAARAIKDHLVRNGICGKVEEAPNASAYNKVVYALPKNIPDVEIIIPTRDSHHLLRQCIDSIQNITTYQNYSITIIDNGSIEQETLDLFSSYAVDTRIRVVQDNSPFNYSVINNRIAIESKAELVCLMNNDIEVIGGEWLTEMVSLGILDGVGAVGAKLLYPDNTIQHAGIILGIGGVAGHSHKFFPRYAPGYFCRNLLRSSMSAVTGACLLICSSIYKEVGGLEEKLEIAFNDVDFCLRVLSAGYRNVWTPYAELYHHESASRGFEDTPEKQDRFNREIAFMKKRWGNQLLDDPSYSVNLTLDSEDFAISMLSRARKGFE